jgi:hypothetical protein
MSMMTPERGDTMVRVVPPIDGAVAYVQAGTVDKVTADTIELLVQVDMVRRMRFRRSDGMDTEGIGSFVIPGRMWQAA